MDIPFEGLEIFKIPDLKEDISIINKEIDLLVIADSHAVNHFGDLLNNILKAINKSDDDSYMLIALDDEESVNLSSLHSKINFNTVLNFYVPLTRLGLNIKAYRNKLLETESFNIIITNSLKDINDNKKYKLALWDCLRKNFN